MATGMFDSSENTYRFNVIVLSAILATAIICGGIFDFCRWMKHRMKRGTVTLKNCHSLIYYQNNFNPENWLLN